MEIRIKLYEAEKIVPAKSGNYFTIDAPKEKRYYKSIAELGWSAKLQGWNLCEWDEDSRKHEMFPKYWGEIEVIEE